MNPLTPLSPLMPAPADAPVAPAISPELERQAKAAAEKFEGFFIAQMMRQMRSMSRQIAGEDGVFRDRTNDDMLDMADTMVADAMAGQRAFGIADMILRQVLPAPQPLPLPLPDRGRLSGMAVPVANSEQHDRNLP
jgi:Rod binding domain-containing protein